MTTPTITKANLIARFDRMLDQNNELLAGLDALLKLAQSIPALEVQAMRIADDIEEALRDRADIARRRSLARKGTRVYDVDGRLVPVR